MPGAQHRLLGLLLLGNLALYPILFGVPQVLLPGQLDRIDPAGKVADFGLVAGVASVVGALAQPIAGALSDRSTSRFGRRSPFLLTGGATAAACLWLLSRGSTVPVVLLWWSLTTLALNVYQAALVAIVPDQVTVERRGQASSVVALTVPLGLVLGIAVATATVDRGTLGPAVLGAALLLAATVLVVGLRDAATTPGHRATGDVGRRPPFLSSLQHRDFRLALLGRFLLFLGFLGTDSFLLFLLQDQVALPNGWSPEQGVLTLAVVGAGGVLATAASCGWLSDRLRRRKPFVVVGVALYAVAVVPVLIDTTWPALLAYSLVSGLGFGCYYALDTAIGTLVLPSSAHHARDLGIFNLGYVAAVVVGPPLGATLVNVTGGYAALFVSGVVLAAAGALTVLRIHGIR